MSDVDTISVNDNNKADADADVVFPLELFRMLAKADEEQSILSDISTLAQNPDPLWIVIIMVIILANTRSIASKSKHKRQQSYPSWVTMSLVMAAFGILFQLGFDVMGVVVNSEDTATKNVSSIYKPYTDFAQFYQEAYTDAHLEPASRVSHGILVTSVLYVWIYDTRLFVASATALLVGASSTVPLIAYTSNEMPFLEMMLVLFVGLAVSRIFYATMVRWLVFYLVWISLDYLDHHFLGRNGSVAMYMGQHYISWALIGQLQLAFGMLWNNLVTLLHINPS